MVKEVREAFAQARYVEPEKVTEAAQWAQRNRGGALGPLYVGGAPANLWTPQGATLTMSSASPSTYFSASDVVGRA